MRSLPLKSSRAMFSLLLVLMLAASLPTASLSAQPTQASISLVCENNSPNVNLKTADGYIGLPDGNTVYMWGYATAAGSFQHPGPTLCFTEGQVVTITLTNNVVPEAVSIIFPGQTGVEANTGSGFAPSEPQFAGPTLVSLAPAAAAGGGVVTYRFTASQPGTYIYESGTDPQKQVQMGLFGAIVIRPLMGSGDDHIYNWSATQFSKDHDYMMLLSEIDPELHWAVEIGLPYDITRYHPRYWLINGRSFPDTIAPNNAEWLPTQPYGALLHILPSGAQGLPSAVRFLNVGMFNHPMHPHGDHIQIVGRDGRPLLGPANEDLSYAEYGPVVGAGQTKDAIYDWTNVDGYSTSNPLPTDVFQSLSQFLLRPRDQNLMWGEWFSGSPYLGETTDRPVGVTAQGECGEYYHIWHSHALHEAANYEAGFGGMITLERIDPPGGC